MSSKSNLARTQPGLFDAQSLAATVVVPAAPPLVPHHDWPFPGMTPEDSARACMAISESYRDMLATVIKSQGGAELTDKQVLALVPADWRDLCGQYAHGTLGLQCGQRRGIRVNYVAHDGGGFHFTFQAVHDTSWPTGGRP
jgi:hypothetical protein